MENSTRSPKTVIIIALSVFFTCLVGICAFALYHPQEFWDEIIYGGRPQQNPIDDPPGHYEYYQINPLTILSDLRNGKSMAFHQVEEPDIFRRLYPSGYFPWSQNDYLALAKAHHAFLTGETFESGWMIFSFGKFGILQCKDGMKGFDWANITFYKETPTTFPVIDMVIRPLEGLIYSAYVEYERRPLAVGFSKAVAFEGTITADDALNIAESAGGASMRDILSNNGCSLTITYHGSENWYVDYWWETRDLEFYLEYKINIYDGRYKISQRTYKCERTVCP